MLMPLTRAAWNRDSAAHLAQRAGFGVRRDELERLADAGPEAAVDSFLGGAPLDGEVSPPPPAWTTAPPVVPPSMGMVPMAPEDLSAKQAFARERRRETFAQIHELTRWWLTQMANGPAPLREKLALFWHSHFATGNDKVNSAPWMWRQNETFRRMGLGDVRALTKAISRDPAMIVWLDLRGSSRGNPNENFSRELLELFTLGEGNYAEEDVKEAARAFTGRKIDRATNRFRFAAAAYDPGEKRLFGALGPWDGDATIDLIFSQSACARFLARKFWRFFVSDEPPRPELAEALAAELRKGGYVVGDFLRTLFLSKEFYADSVRRSQIKSPVQLIAQASRTLGWMLPEPEPLARTLRRLGQEPFYPPNVKGWDGGKAWINTATLGARYALARPLVFGRNARPAKPATRETVPAAMAALAPGPLPTSPSESPVPPLAVATLVTADERRDPERLVRALGVTVFGGEPPPPLLETLLPVVTTGPKPVDDAGVRELLAVMLATPDYQLC